MELRKVRHKHKNNVLVSYLNINNLRYKLTELIDVLYDKLTYICFFAETKLDITFNDNLFSIPQYNFFRNDRNSSGGGLIAYVRSNLPARRRHDLEFDNPIETIVLDIQINNRKWAIIGAYRPPSLKNHIFSDILTKGLDKLSIHFDNVMLLGDLNYDCLDRVKS